MITYLRIKNYKSLKDVELHLPPFSVLVGANASGKTNFVDCLDFLGRCFRYGLAEAIGAKGGYENVSFRRARRAKGALEFTIKAAVPTNGAMEQQFEVSEFRLEYRFGFRAKQQAIAAEYEVTNEYFDLSFQHGGHTHHLRLDRKKGLLDSPSDTVPGFLPAPEFVGRALMHEVPPNELFLPIRLGPWYALMLVSDLLSNVGVYQLSPTSARAPGDPSGPKELGRTGTNLPAAIQYLEKTDKKAFQELLAHLRRAVSSFKSIETDYVETKQLGLFLREEGVGRRWYANDLSDGTLQTVAIFLPLLDSRLSLIALEEPENGLHPWVLQDFIETCRERSNEKQIIVTTHSPIVVSHLRPSELMLVDRHKGQTRIVRAVDADRSVEDIIRDGVTDLGSYWNSGQMSAVPGGPSLFDLVQENGNHGV